MKTKRFTLIVICLLTLPFASQAQKGWKVGGYFLPQFVNLYNQDEADFEEARYGYKPLAGMGLGLQGGYHFNDVFGFRLGVNYSQEGKRYSSSLGLPDTVLYTQRLEYVQIPLMLTLNTNPVLSKASFVVSAGAQANFLVKASEYDNSQQVNVPLPDGVSSVPSVMSRYTPVTYSAVGEVGMDIKVAYNATFNLRLRAVYGLVDSENKDASMYVRSNGVTQQVPYWIYVRGSEHDAISRQLNAGLVIGLTYTLAGNY